MQLLDGQTLSQKIAADLKLKISNLKFQIKLDVILVGHDQPSLKYVARKEQKCRDLGIKFELHQLDELVNPAEILTLIKKLNSDTHVTGFFVQLPLPEKFFTEELLNAIDPAKDVDGLTAKNLGLLFQSDPSGIPSATALGIIRLLEEYKIGLVGKNVVIVNNTPLVGLPLAALCNSRRATVDLCHIDTHDLKSHTLKADILISATGVKNLITAEFVKNGAVVVDVANGDVDFAGVSPKCSFITPTFGGVGPMTVISLLGNLIRLSLKNGQK